MPATQTPGAGTSKGIMTSSRYSKPWYGDEQAFHHFSSTIQLLKLQELCHFPKSYNSEKAKEIRYLKSWNAWAIFWRNFRILYMPMFVGRLHLQPLIAQVSHEYHAQANLFKVVPIDLDY